MKKNAEQIKRRTFLKTSLASGIAIFTILFQRFFHYSGGASPRQEVKSLGENHKLLKIAGKYGGEFGPSKTKS